MTTKLVTPPDKDPRDTSEKTPKEPGKRSYATHNPPHKHRAQQPKPSNVGIKSSGTTHSEKNH